MAYEEKYKKAESSHSLIMEGREKLSVSGVEDVESFDDSSVVMYTAKGLLTVKGIGLHIGRLSLDGGDISIEGNIESLSYENDISTKEGFFSRIFK